jgi:Ca2+-binding RTX toxin-like protein
MTGLVGGAIASAPPPGSLALPPVEPVAGDDALSGGDGSDTVLAGPGADIVDGGAAGDLLFGEDGADSIGGGDGDDLILGGAGDDFLVGEAGDDTLFGDSGQDILLGGDGQDRLYADGSDRAVLGGPSFDTLVIQGSVSGLANIDLAAADNQNQSGSGPTIVGIERIDASLADAGVSVHGATFGGNGSTVYGSAFQDTIVGSDGNDRLYGNTGNDSIDGGLGNDQIYVGLGNDTVIAGAGADSIYYGGGMPGDGIVQVMDFLPGTDHVVFPTAVLNSANNAVLALNMTGDGAILLLETGAGILFVGVAAVSLSASDFIIVDSF